MLLESGFRDQAVTYLKRALRLAPDRPDAHFFLAFAYYEGGDYTRASKAAKRAGNLARKAGNQSLMEAIRGLQAFIAFARSPLGRLGLFESYSDE
jgi:tetratricopeptide (TPR) repeat protein